MSPDGDPADDGADPGGDEDDPRESPGSDADRGDATGSDADRGDATGSDADRGDVTGRSAGPGNATGSDVGPGGAVEWSVPGEADPFECPYCGRPFPRERLRSLHVGLDHGDRAEGAERTAYREAYAAETENIRLFRLKVLAVLVLLYFGTLFAYSIVT